MGIVPLQYQTGENAQSLGLTGKELFTIEVPEDVSTGQLVTIKVIWNQDYLRSFHYHVCNKKELCCNGIFNRSTKGKHSKPSLVSTLKWSLNISEMEESWMQWLEACCETFLGRRMYLKRVKSILIIFTNLAVSITLNSLMLAKVVSRKSLIPLQY